MLNCRVITDDGIADFRPTQEHWTSVVFGAQTLGELFEFRKNFVVGLSELLKFFLKCMNLIRIS